MNIVLRRSKSRPAHGHSNALQSLVLAVCFAILVLCNGVAGSSVDAAEQLEARTGILIDRREPPTPLVRRGSTRTTTTTTTTLPSSIVQSTALSNTAAASKTSTAAGTLATDPSLSNYELPRPFDGSLGDNFTASSCPKFIHGFLRDDDFNDCLALSLLLQTSTSFFVATRSPGRLTDTLNATCNVDFPKCSALMSRLALELQSRSACGQDLSLQNPVVVEAYNGFMAYAPLYHAGCMMDIQGEYCFAAAATNASAPTSSYVYYLPLGVSLPSAMAPSCNSCLRNTMGVFHHYANNSTQPLNGDYATAAQQVDALCGKSFAVTQVATTSGAAPRRTLPSPLLFALVTFCVLLLG